MKLKPFADNDWDAFAGAEEFKDGSDPMISTEGEALVIADRDGIFVWLSEDEDCWGLELKNLTKRAIVIFAESLPIELTEKDLKEFGFKRV